MRPIIALAVAFAAGDIAGLLYHPRTMPLLALAAAAGLVLTSVRGSGRRSIILALGSFALIGWADGAAWAIRARSDCREQLRDGARLSGTATIDGLAEPGASVFLRIEHESIDGPRAPCAVAVRARLPQRTNVLRHDGADPARVIHVVFEGTWWRNTNASVWVRPPEHAGSLALASVRVVERRHRHPLLAIRLSILRSIHDRFGRESGLAESLLLARRENLDDDIRRDFTAAGLAHLLAISGAHVGIVAALVVLLAGLAHIGPQRAAFASVAVTLAYVILLGAPSAAARAALQTISVLAARMLQRPADRNAGLATAALMIIALRPRSILDPGFQLSFAGVYGLGAFTTPIAEHMPRRLPRWLRAALAPTLAATAATLPIAAWQFGQIPLVGPAANLLGAPLLALAVPAVIATLGTGILSDTAANFLAGGARACLRALEGIAHAFAAVPHGNLWVGTDVVTGLLVAAACGLIAGAAARPRSRDQRATSSDRARFLTRIAAAVTVLLVLPVLRSPGGRLDIHVIDVGQGDAFAIRTPGDHWILIDTGPLSPRFDAGRDRVAPYLRRLGVDRIDLIILSHPHADHIGGLDFLWSTFDVGAILDPAVPASEDLYIDLIARAARDRRAWLAGRAGRELRIDDVTVRVLAPEDSLLDRLTDPNDYSVIVRLEYGRFAALFEGDAPRIIENRVVEAWGPSLAADVLKVGHHGSRTSTGDSLLDAVHPKIAIVSVGRRNRYGHPSPTVIGRLERRGIRILRTDRDGSVIVRARSDGSHELLRAR